MAKIMRNGQVWSQTSYYKDIEEKPTINGHELLETNNTSASLEIFKNITKAEYEDPDFEPNYQTVYAVHDEEGNFRIHFWNQTEDPTVLEPIEYILEDYREVLELPADEKADSTVLYYLKKDWTNPDTDVLYKKGLWGWVDVSEDPGVQDFKWILFTQTPVDEKTIYNNELGEASTQIGGYLFDDVETTKVMVVNKQDAFELQVDEEAKLNTVKFPYSNYNAYTPNTMYKITFKYGDQMPKTFETDSKLLDGVKIGEFGKLTFTDEYLYVVLDSTVYDSDDLEDYNLTVEWQKPDKVSAINPLFFPVDESLTINNKGELGVGSVKNGWQSIHKIEDYLYQTYFSGMDYFYAEEYFKSMNTTAGFCSTVRSGNFIGRNHDQVYSELAEFIVETPNRTGRYATVGIAGGIEELTKEKVESGDYVKASRVVPFMVFDGMNEKGVVASINKVPCDKEPTTITEPEIEAKKTLCGYQLPRFVLDNFATAREGAEFIRDYVAVYMTDALQEEGYELNLMISDKDESFVIEFIDNENNLMNAIAAPYCTNFYVTDMTPNVDRSVYTPADVPTHTPSVDNNITEHGKGLERYNLINRSVNPLTPYTAVAQMRLLMRQLYYTNTYAGIGGADPWVSEFTGVGDITVDTPAADIIADDGVQAILTKYLNRSRDPLDEDYGTLHTSHTAIYDVVNKTIIISVQEGTTEYMFALPQEEGVDGELFIGPISDVSIDSSQNAILQTILDGIFNENKAYVLNYNNQEKLLTSATTLYDDYGAYLPFSGVIHNSYTLLRVYYDEPTKLVMGAKRYDITPVRYQLEDIPEGSPLATNCAVCVCDDYRKITFSSPDPFHIGTVMGWKGDGGVQYSYNKKDWFDWDGTTVLDANVRNMYGVYDIHFRGVENTYLYKSETEYTAFKVTMDESASDKHNVEVRGNCVYMLDFNTDVPETLDNIFRKLFSGGAALEQSKSLVLPFTSLGNHSYQDMFKGCSYLTNCPQIPAIETKIESCDGMFDGCTNLIEPPTLPATVLGEGCYRNMFRNCASITEAPLLEAMVLNDYCYEGMFEGCISLEECPDLPAVMLPVPKGAYKNMFKNCKAITKTPVLEAVIIGDEAYYGMFSGTLITEFTGKLKAMTLGVSAYESMFQACTKLTKMPELPAKKASKRCYANMFYGCTALVDLIDLPMDVVAEECCLQMFMNCTTLIDPLELPAKTLAPSCYRSMFEGCKAINWYPAGHPYKVPCTGIGTSAANAMTNMFKGNTGRAGGSVPGGGTPVVNTVYYCRPRKNEYLTFEAPAAFSLVSAWSDNVNILYSRDNGKLWNQWGGGAVVSSALLPDELTNDNVNKFYICGRLTDTSKDYPIRGSSGNNNVKVYGKIKYMSSIHEDDWKAEIPPTFCYRALFYQNSFLVDASGLELIDNLTSPHCYRSMFHSCNRLSVPPTLPKNVSIAHEYSHYQMFRDCDSLTKMDNQVLPAETVNKYAYAYMFYDCDNLLTPILELPGGLEGGYEYYYMFGHCDQLRYASEIKAKIFNVNSCRDMFVNCVVLTECQEEIQASAFTGNYSMCRMFENTALEKAPKLPAMDLGGYCYDNMFLNCKSLVEPPELPATVMAPYCYNGMFNGCTKLATCPELPAMELAVGCYTYMFSGCTSIKKPVKLPATKLMQNCYAYMYNGCTGIKWFLNFGEPYRIPTTGTGTTATDWNTNMFAGNTPMGTATLPGGTTGSPAINTNYYLAPIEWVTFSAPAQFTLKRSSGTTKTTVYSKDKENWYEMSTSTITCNNQNELYVCSREEYAFLVSGGDHKVKVVGKLGYLVDQHAGVMSTTTITRSLFHTSEIYDASELKLELINGKSIVNCCFGGMFAECPYLEFTPTIPVITNYNITYGFCKMFQSCTALEKAPDVDIMVKSGTTTARGIFNGMFMGCTKLKEISKFHTNEVLIPEQLSYTFANCSSLEKAPAMKITGVIGSTGTNNYHMDGTFKGCTKLSDTTELDMAELHFTKNDGNPSYCLRDTFNGCSALKESVLMCQNNDTNYIPSNCFYGTFSGSGVENIVTIKVSHAGGITLNSSAFFSMYSYCQNLTTKTKGVFLLDGYFRYYLPGYLFRTTFYGCQNLVYAPILCYQATGEGATNKGYDYYCTFQNCHNLQNVPMRMFAGGGNPGTYTYGWAFSHTSLPYPVTMQGGTYTVGSTNYSAAANSFVSATADATEKPWATAYENGASGSYQTYAEYTNGYYMGTAPTDTSTFSNYALNGRGNNVPTNGWQTRNPFYYRTPVKFVAPAEFTTYLPPNFCYSTDWFEWKVNSGTTKLAVTSGTEGDKSVLWVRYGGVNRTYPGSVETYLESEAITQIGGNNQIRVFGNLSGLCGESGSCQCLFYNNKALYDVSGLNAGQMVGNNKYRAMFMGCSSLEHPIPLEQKNCSYANMFFNMYTNCTALKVPSSFTNDITANSTMNAANVCREMYKGCTALLYVPNIPFTTFGARALRDMFMDCKSLKYPVWSPTSAVTSIADDACSGMFRNCTGIIWLQTSTRSTGESVNYKLDKMPAGSTDMFEGTTAVGASIPTAAGSYYVAVGKPGTGLCISGSSTFKIRFAEPTSYSLDGNSWVVCVAGAIITPTNNKIYIKSMGHRNYRQTPMFTFESGSNLKLSGDVQSWMYNIPCCAYAFKGATAISDASELIFPDHTAPSCYDYMFYGCTNLTKYPSLPASYIEHWSYRNMFQNTASTTLATMPSSSITIAIAAIEGMYRGNTKLTSAAGFPQISDGVVPVYGAANMFYGCTSLTAVPNWTNICDIGPYSFYCMFYSCPNITEGFTLANVKIYPRASCYGMYRACTKLKQPVKLGTVRWLGSICFEYMYYGCTGIIFASSGTSWTISLGNWNNVIGTDCVYHMFTGCSGTLPVYHAWTGTPLLAWTYYFSS